MTAGFVVFTDELLVVVHAGVTCIDRQCVFSCAKRSLRLNVMRRYPTLVLTVSRRMGLDLVLCGALTDHWPGMFWALRVRSNLTA